MYKLLFLTSLGVGTDRICLKLLTYKFKGDSCDPPSVGCGFMHALVNHGNSRRQSGPKGQFPTVGGGEGSATPWKKTFVGDIFFSYRWSPLAPRQYGAEARQK